jgi:hypothetical protein
MNFLLNVPDIFQKEGESLMEVWQMNGTIKMFLKEL